MTAIIFAVGLDGGGLGNASILRMARLLRLSRMARMARLFRAMPELLILINGMAAAMRSVGFTLLLLIVVLYVFGIAFRQLVGETCRSPEGHLYFDKVIVAMHTLLLHGTLTDGLRPLVDALAAESLVFACVFYVFLMLSALTITNMLI